MINALCNGFEGRSLRSTLLLYLGSTLAVGLIAVILREYLTYRVVVMITPLLALVVVSLQSVALFLRRRLSTTSAEIDGWVEDLSLSWLILKSSFAVVTIMMTMAAFTEHHLLAPRIQERIVENLERGMRRANALLIAIGLLFGVVLSMLLGVMIYLLMLFDHEPLLRVSFSFVATLVLIFISLLFLPALSRGRRKNDLRELRRNQWRQ